MLLAWIVVRKMIRIARTYRITSIADFIASRYGKSPLLAGAGDADHRRRHRPLHRAAAEGGRRRLPPADHAAGRRSPRRRPGGATARSTSRWRSPPSPSCSAPATSTAPSGTRAWSPPIAFESVVKLRRLPRRRRLRHLGPLRRHGRHLGARAGGARAARAAPPRRRGRRRLRLRAVVRADPAVDALGAAAAAAVPGDGGRDASTSGTCAGPPGSSRSICC